MPCHKCAELEASLTAEKAIKEGQIITIHNLLDDKKELEAKLKEAKAALLYEKHQKYGQPKQLEENQRTIRKLRKKLAAIEKGFKREWCDACQVEADNEGNGETPCDNCDICAECFHPKPWHDGKSCFANEDNCSCSGFKPLGLFKSKHFPDKQENTQRIKTKKELKAFLDSLGEASK